MQDVDGAAVLGQHAGDGVDRLRADLEPLPDQLLELVDDAASLHHRHVVAVQDQLVAAQERAHLEALRQGRQQLVGARGELARELIGDGQRFAGHVPQSRAVVPCCPRRASAAEPLLDEARHGRPSARPSVRAITSFITAPISRGDVAPASAIAASTIAASSSAPSSSGR